MTRSATDPATAPAGIHDSEPEDRSGLVKTLAAILLNIGVLTALLVYFGWARSDRMADELGIDEAILGMSAQDYLLRSVQSVFIPILVAGVAGLAWFAFDRWWVTRRATKGAGDRFVMGVARWTWLFAVGVVILGVVLGFLGYAETFIAGPLVCAGGLLLLMYGMHLRGTLDGAVPMSALAETVFRGAVVLLVAVGVFWSATNFAVVEGTALARGYEDRIADLPGVEVDSMRPLDIAAPGVRALCRGEGELLRYRYTGLRLLDRTGSNYFLISDDWTEDYGVVVALSTDGEGTRFTFVRDRDGLRDDGGYVECRS